MLVPVPLGYPISKSAAGYVNWIGRVVRVSDIVYLELQALARGEIWENVQARESMGDETSNDFPSARSLCRAFTCVSMMRPVSPWEYNVHVVLILCRM